MAPTRSAVVVGAGIGGLATAGALARTGWRVTLLERGDRLRGARTALLLWPSGARALAALGLGDGVDAISAPVPDPGLRHPDGRWLVLPDPARHPDPPLLVHAEDLHDALVAGLSDLVEIHTGVAVERPDRSADAPAITDGRTVWRADLVVAADGIHSALREPIGGPGTVVSAGVTVWRAVIPWFRAPELGSDLAPPGETRGGRYQLVTAVLAARGGTGSQRGSWGGYFWRATVPGAARPESPERQLQLLRRWFGDWHSPIGELLAATEPGDLVQQELYALRPAPRRYAAPVGPGAMVLLGDAGHALPEVLGQGAGLALEDAATLVTAVQGATPGPALHAATAQYDAARRRRVAEVRRAVGRLGAAGRFARLAPVLARRRYRATVAATEWQPPG